MRPPTPSSPEVEDLVGWSPLTERSSERPSIPAPLESSIRASSPAFDEEWLPPPEHAPPTVPTRTTLRPPPPESSGPSAPLARRLRVSVRTSVRDPTLLVVRVLPEGQPPPPGTREAFLLMADVRDTLIDDAELAGVDFER